MIVAILYKTSLVFCYICQRYYLRELQPLVQMYKTEMDDRSIPSYTGVATRQHGTQQISRKTFNSLIYGSCNVVKEISAKDARSFNSLIYGSCNAKKDWSTASEALSIPSYTGVATIHQEGKKWKKGFQFPHIRELQHQNFFVLSKKVGLSIPSCTGVATNCFCVQIASSFFQFPHVRELQRKNTSCVLKFKGLSIPSCTGVATTPLFYD
jgi:hypothetical protein